MGVAAQTHVIASKEKAITRKRPLKPLKASSTHYISNIFVIRNLQCVERKKSLSRIHAVKAGNSVVVPACTHVSRKPWVGESAVDSAKTQASVFSKMAVARIATAAPFTHRDKIILGVLSALAMGALLGTALISNEQNEPTKAAVGAKVPLLSSSQQSLAVVMQDSEINSPPSAPHMKPDLELYVQPVLSNVDPIGQLLDSTPVPTAEYLVQIDRLRSENEIFSKEVIRLDVETTDLQLKLLQLELAMMALDLEAQQRVEVRTVYNFVNEPSGGTLANNIEANDNTGSSLESEVYDDPTQPQTSVPYDKSIQPQESVQYDNLAPSQQSEQYDDTPPSQESIQHDDTAISWESQFETEFVDALVGPSGTGDINQ